ncbi:unnamed protein product [marine sediment metagenome]|uniref:Uncharacterized protein n=1 Tax=marine sediment metagenome TaxID=412755 RepID=X1J202_9ZZZZ
MTLYRGFVHSDRVGRQLVTRGEDILSPGPSQRLWNHSPTGFSWGYGGSGPAQLALALLYDVTKDKELSLKLHQDFKWDRVAHWEGDWEITDGEIRRWLEMETEVEAG